MYVCMYVFMYEPSHPPSSLDMHWVFYAAILGSILWFDQSGSCKVFVCGECARREELGEGVLVYTIGYWNDLDVLLCNLAECSGALFGAYRAAGGRDWAAIRVLGWSGQGGAGCGCPRTKVQSFSLLSK